MSVPVSDRVDFLRRERRKYEVWKLGLPGQSLGFIQGELEHAFMLVQCAARLGEDGRFGLPDLRENLSARSQAELAERASDTCIHPDFVRLFQFHIFHTIHTL